MLWAHLDSWRHLRRQANLTACILLGCKFVQQILSVLGHWIPGLWIPGHWIPGQKRHRIPRDIGFRVNFTIPETGSMIYDFAFWSATHFNPCNACIQMVGLAPKTKHINWPFEFNMVRFSNGDLKTGLKKPVYGEKCLLFKWSAKSCEFTIWKLDTHAVQYSGNWYSDGYCLLLRFQFILNLNPI